MNLPPLITVSFGFNEAGEKTPSQYEADSVEARERILLARIAELEADAERYRYLRKAHWSDSPLCVVTIPKRNTVLGADLPSGDRLDAAIDAARGAKL